jgi:hypothetical protein
MGEYSSFNCTYNYAVNPQNQPPTSQPNRKRTIIMNEIASPTSQPNRNRTIIINEIASPKLESPQCKRSFEKGTPPTKRWNCRVARFFTKKIPKWGNTYIPNDHKIYQMTVTYTNILYSKALKDICTQIAIFCCTTSPADVLVPFVLCQESSTNQDGCRLLWHPN